MDQDATSASETWPWTHSAFVAPAGDEEGDTHRFIAEHYSASVLHICSYSYFYIFIYLLNECVSLSFLLCPFPSYFDEICQFQIAAVASTNHNDPPYLRAKQCQTHFKAHWREPATLCHNRLSEAIAGYLLLRRSRRALAVGCRSLRSRAIEADRW